MAPTRVGLFGLQPKDVGETVSFGSWGVQAHLASIRAMPEDYEIVAVANSTVASAQKAIESHGLPAGTKAYGNPQDLANDTRVELVVVSVRVPKHSMLTKPALEKKKDIFVEWPLGRGLAESEELAKLASAAGVRTMVGLQARAEPVVIKAKELVTSGKIGQVVSSTATLQIAIPFDLGWPKGAEYYLDMKSGGNEYFIYFGHFVDSFTHVLGDFADIKATLNTYTTSVALVNEKGEVLDPAYPKTTPDHIFVQGKLESGAMASIAVRNAKASVDGVGVRWIITGTEGEIEVTMPENHWQFADANKALRLKIGREEAKNVDVLTKDDKLPEKVASLGLNTARQYQGFAKGDTETCATFESALKTHRLLDRILKDAGWESI